MKSITTTMMRVRERESAREREKIENQGKVAMRGIKIRSKTTISCGGLSGTQTRESAFASFCARGTSIFYFFLFYTYFFFFFFSWNASYLEIHTSSVILLRTKPYFSFLLCFLFATFPVTRMDLRLYCIPSFRRRHRFLLTCITPADS